MRQLDEMQVLLNIQELIDKNRCSKDGFFTDSKTAANEILKYLQNERIIIKNEVAVEISFNEKSRAA